MGKGGKMETNKELLLLFCCDCRLLRLWSYKPLQPGTKRCPMLRTLLAALLALLFLVLCGAFKGAGGWLVPRFTRRALFQSATAASNLDGLNDHIRQAAELSSAVTMWLNAEYAQDSSHEAVGEVVRSVYLDNRVRGVNNVEQLLTHLFAKVNETSGIKGGLMQTCMVVSKVEDILSIMMENVRHANGTSQEENPTRGRARSPLRLEEMDDSSVWDLRRVKSLSRALSSAFERYKILRDFLEGEDVWADMNVLIALTLGFRLQGSSAFTLVEELAPVSWTTLRRPILFNTTYALPLYDKMAADVQEQEDGIESLFDALLSADLLVHQKLSKDPAVQRRLVLVKWLFVHGALANPFPHTTRYIYSGSTTQDDVEVMRK